MTLRKKNLHNTGSGGSNSQNRNNNQKLSVDQLEMMTQGKFIPIFLAKPLSECKSPVADKTFTPPPLFMGSEN